MTWKTVKLGDAAAIERNGVKGDTILAGTQYLGLEHIESGGRVLGPQRVGPGDLASTKFCFTTEHVLYGKLRPYLAKIALPEFSGVCSTDILPVLPGRDLDRRFLAYLLRQPDMVAYASSLAAGANLPRLSPKALASFEIPLPPLDEQRRIAAVLDKADALRRQRQQSLQLTDQLLQAIFLDMFGDPIANPKGLPTVALSKIADLERGKFTPRPRNDPSFYGGSHPFIQTGDISRANGRITTWTQTLNERGASVSKEFGQGTVVIAIVGATLGETAIVETPVYCPDSIIGITPIKERSTPEFIELLLRLWKPRLKEQAPDAARANLNLARLRPLRALAPGIDAQQAFSGVAQRLRTLHLASGSSASTLDALFSSLQQLAFRGELDLSKLELDAPDTPGAADIPDDLAGAGAETERSKLPAESTGPIPSARMP